LQFVISGFNEGYAEIKNPLSARVPLLSLTDRSKSSRTPTFVLMLQLPKLI